MDYYTILAIAGIGSATIAASILMFSKELESWRCLSPHSLTRLFLAATAIAVSVVLIIFRQSTWNWDPITQLWVSLGAVALLTVLFARSGRISEAVLPRGETAASLAWVRIVVCASLLFLATRVRLSDLAILPPELIRFETMISPLLRMVLDDSQLRDPVFLGYLQGATIITLSCAMLGLGTRMMLVAAALCYTVSYHLQIIYTHFYHSGLIPLQILYVLCFMPTYRALALDNVIATRFLKKPTLIESGHPKYNWCVYLCWSIYGVSYCATGLSKFWVNPFWASDGNVLRMSLSDSLHLIEYDFNLAAHMVSWGIAEPVFLLVGISAMVIEWAGILILLYGWARLVLPWLIFGLHIGIWLCHDFLFYDLVILPLMFLLQVIAALRGTTAVPEGSLAEGSFVRYARSAAGSAICTLITAGWLYSRDVFPLLSYWGMYAVHAKQPLEWVHYATVFKVRASGARERTELIEYFSVLNHAHWLDHVGYRPDPNDSVRMRALFNKVFELERSEADPVTSFEVESNSWNVRTAPDDKNFGVPTHRLRFSRDGTVVEERLQ